MSSPTNLPEPAAEATELLQAGIAAAKAGQREQARSLLLHVTELDERNAAAWLWLSGLVDRLEDREICLENVLALEPAHQAAQQGLLNVQRQLAARLLHEGIAAARAGQRETASTLLRQALDRDATNLSAWLWLSGVVDDLAEREQCLLHAIALDPANERLHQALSQVQIQKHLQPPPFTAAAPSPSALPSPSAPPPLAATEPSSPTAELFPPLPPPAAPTETAGPDALTAAGEPAGPVPAHWQELTDEYLCPACAAPTAPADKRCPACRQALWVHVRRREERSTELWILIAFQALGTLSAGVAPLVALALIGWRLNVKNFFDFIPLYLGLPHTLKPAVAQAAFQLLPRGTLLASLGPFLLALGLLIGLYARWRPMFYILIAGAVLEVTYAVLSIVLSFGLSLLFSGFNIALAFVQFFLVLRTEDDFITDRQRILLRLDRDAKTALTFLERGRLYSKTKLWALAAIHLRRAAAMMPEELGPRLALTVAYFKLRRPELAAQTLAEARRLAPDDPRVAELAALILK